jgi:hypothetical protein
MHTIRPQHLIFATVLGLAAVPPSQAQTVGAIAITKSQTFLQSSASAPASHALPGVPDGSFSFDAVVVGSNLNLLVGPPKLTLPDSTQYTLTNGDPVGNSLYLLTSNVAPKDFSSKSALDAAFPNGTYGVTINSTKVSLQFGAADAYPADAPRVTNGTWDSQGSLVVNATTGATLNFNPFAGYANNGSITLEIYPVSGANFGPVVATGQSINLPGVANDPALTTYTIPAGLLQPNQLYYAELTYGRIVNSNVSNPLGAYGFAAFGDVTGFVITTTPAPTAPVITSQFGNQTVIAGASATFSVAASGTPAPSFQWQRQAAGDSAWSNLSDGGAYAGTGSATLTIGVATPAMNGDQFRCVATNVAGTATSAAALLTVNPAVAPTITNMLATVALDYGNSIYLAPTVTGSQPITFQWSKDGVPLPGANSPVFTKVMTTADSGQYTLTAANFAGTVTSTAVMVTVNPATPPTVYNLPATVTLGFGETLWLVPNRVTGTDPITFQWSKDGVPLPNATSSDYLKIHVTTGDSGQYLLTATNFVGTTTYTVAVTVNAPVAPTISGLPASAVVNYGEFLVFSPTISGTEPITYQWSKDGVPLPNEIFANYAMPNATLAAGGQYTLTATNSVGATTFTVTVSVNAPTAPTISGLPALVVVEYGNGLQLYATVTGTQPFTCQWYKDGAPLPGANSVFYGKAATPADSGQYTLVATNSFGSTTSSNVTVTVNPAAAPTISGLPAAITLNYGDPLTLLPSVTGTQLINYQWSKDGAPLPNATIVGYYRPNATMADSGRYTLTATNSVGTTTSAIVTVTVKTGTSVDFNGDGKADLFWSNTYNGDRYLWQMNGGSVASNSFVGTISADWSATTADFNGDGKSDLLWSNSANGDRYLWLMNGGAVTTSVFLGTIGTAWIATTGDFNGDGKADILWSNTASGDRYVWSMNGGSVAGSFFLGTISTQWIPAVGDFNGDGKSDLLWSNTVDGDRYLWLMNGGTIANCIFLGTVPIQWMPAVGDFNGDDKADIFWSNCTNGDRYLWLMNGGSVASSIFVGTVSPQWNATTGDFDGDGKSDLVWSNSGNGDRYLWLMNGGTVTNSIFVGTVDPNSWTAP